MERAPARGASPPPGALSYRTGRCPIGQVGRGGRARCLIGRGDDPFAGVMDPDRDPRFIATGRAAIAAMTCGQIDLLTSTPLGRRTYCLTGKCDALAGSGLLALPGPRVFGATPLDHVAKKRAPARGASPPPSALSYRTGRCPIGQVGRGGRARCLIGRGDDPIAGVMDPDRDPRFIATGRAAIAAMTCGQIDLLTSTPLGCRTHQSVYQCDTLAGSRDCLLCPVHGSRGYAPRPVAKKRAPTRGAPFPTLHYWMNGP